MKIGGAGSAQLVEHEHGVRYTEATAGARQLLPLWIFAP